MARSEEAAASLAAPSIISSAQLQAGKHTAPCGLTAQQGSADRRQQLPQQLGLLDCTAVPPAHWQPFARTIDAEQVPADTCTVHWLSMPPTKRDPEEMLDGDSPANKRIKVEVNGSADGVETHKEPEAKHGSTDAAAKEEAEDEEEAFIPLPHSTTRSAVKKGHECPYLDTILRQVIQERLDTHIKCSRSPAAVGSSLPSAVGRTLPCCMPNSATQSSHSPAYAICIYSRMHMRVTMQATHLSS